MRTLIAHGIPFQVTGGLAAIAHGARRPLYDVDLDVARRDIATVQALFADYVVSPLHHLRDESFDLHLLTLEIEGVPVDVSQAEESYCFAKDGGRVRIDPDLTRATWVDVEGVSVPVQAVDELLHYKRLLGRPTDLLDVEQIVQARPDCA